MYPYFFYRPRPPVIYSYPYANPFLYPHPLFNSFNSQSSAINQQIFNAGVMAGVSQSAISNNIMF